MASWGQVTISRKTLSDLLRDASHAQEMVESKRLFDTVEWILDGIRRQLRAALGYEGSEQSG